MLRHQLFGPSLSFDLDAMEFQFGCHGIFQQMNFTERTICQALNSLQSSIADCAKREAKARKMFLTLD